MKNPVVPGIYIEERKHAVNPLTIDTSCVAAFAGIAERGDAHTPVLIRDFDEYQRVFGGFDTAGVLPVCVSNFFKCGGRECFVVRIVDEENAAPARLKIKCTSGGFTLEARSFGTWGNHIRVRIWHEGERFGEAASVDEEGVWVTFQETPDVAAGDAVRFTVVAGSPNNSVKQYNRIALAVKDKQVLLNKSLKAIGKALKTGQTLTVEKLYFSLQIVEQSRSETYHHISLNPADERYIISLLAKSRLCAVKVDDCQGSPEAFYTRYASGGSDGIADLKAGDFIGYYRGLNDYKGIGCFESNDAIALICVPDMFYLLEIAGKQREEQLSGVLAVQQALVSQAERFSDRFAVLDMPPGLSFREMTEWVQKLNSANAAVYYPFINTIDREDPFGVRSAAVPSSTAVCGIISALDREQGIFHAPANRIINGAVGLTVPINDADIESLYPAGVNVLKYIPGKGVKIWGVCTTSPEPEWRYINVRRTFCRIGKSLKRGCQWAVYEPNNKDLRKKLIRQVSGFLIDLWRKGYLAGTTAEQGFSVRCDEELNPVGSVDKGLLLMEVGLAIAKPAEYFMLSVTAEKEGSRVSIEG